MMPQLPCPALAAAQLQTAYIARLEYILRHLLGPQIGQERIAAARATAQTTIHPLAETLEAAIEKAAKGE
jgi:hypothetical protein